MTINLGNIYNKIFENATKANWQLSNWFDIINFGQKMSQISQLATQLNYFHTGNFECAHCAQRYIQMRAYVFLLISLPIC